MTEDPADPGLPGRDEPTAAANRPHGRAGKGPTIKLSSRPTGEFWEIGVLHEDPQLLALDKPAGLLTSPDPLEPERPSLMHLLQEGLAKPAPWAAARSLAYLANPHRLDFQTSGAFLLAKDKPSLIHLANQFGSERTEQCFVALVQGNPPEDAFRVDARLAPHPARPDYIRVDPKTGKKASTCFQVLERFAGYALVECRPLTSRTHQIRVHLRSCQLPIVGDEMYGGSPLLLSRLKPGYRFKKDRDELPLIGRAGLHAERLSLLHPVTGLPVAIAAPWPKDLLVALKFLRRYAPGRGSPTGGTTDAISAPPVASTPGTPSETAEDDSMGGS